MQHKQEATVRLTDGDRQEIIAALRQSPDPRTIKRLARDYRVNKGVIRTILTTIGQA